MKNNSAVFLLVLITLPSACTVGAPPQPPSLEYDISGSHDLTYEYSSEMTVSISMMGQSMALSQKGNGVYSVELNPLGRGVDAKLSVMELEATISNPMGAPVVLDQNSITGALEFTLDRFGNAALLREPDVDDAAVQMFSGATVAHGFFPGLPGRSVKRGDVWVDTVSFDAGTDSRVHSEMSVLTYAVAGDTVINGRALLVLNTAGTRKSQFDMNMQGMSVTQSSDVRIEGYVLWDYDESVMFESRRSITGEGTVSIPVAPFPLPIRIEANEHTLLQSR